MAITIEGYVESYLNGNKAFVAEWLKKASKVKVLQFEEALRESGDNRANFHTERLLTLEY